MLEETSSNFVSVNIRKTISILARSTIAIWFSLFLGLGDSFGKSNLPVNPVYFDGFTEQVHQMSVQTRKNRSRIFLRTAADEKAFDTQLKDHDERMRGVGTSRTDALKQLEQIVTLTSQVAEAEYFSVEAIEKIIETEKVEAMLEKMGYLAVGRNFVMRC